MLRPLDPAHISSSPRSPINFPCPSLLQSCPIRVRNMHRTQLTSHCWHITAVFSNVVFPIIKYMDPILSPTSSGAFTAQELSGLWSCDPSFYNTLWISITSLSMVRLNSLMSVFSEV
ncbi:hypothetical protein CY34DRAFT_587303 [Suillus luteus UH-Slu-Lm8-n1]|uniref:Uncharacterized protein n=1 Tax=Suillus luteus UH-Slu-Lm8-n1 TaxID=930992 RepID=A0A0D0ATU6_9AGAM|nr:hypothetical protein CY34DRAFT_587303 [Suillus luteus UH-Slu-Lm8-n1]